MEYSSNTESLAHICLMKIGHDYCDMLYHETSSIEIKKIEVVSIGKMLKLTYIDRRDKTSCIQGTYGRGGGQARKENFCQEGGQGYI